LRVRAIARKEFLHVLRDSRSLVLALFIPVMLLTLFGWALSLDVNDVPTVVLDQSGTPQSRELLSHLDGSAYITFREYAASERELTAALDEGRALLAVTIPPGFAEDVLAGRTARIQVVADGSDANTAALAIGYAGSAAQQYGAKLAVERVYRGQAPHLAQAVDYRPLAWYNPALRSQNFIIPGLIALIMVVIAALLSSLTVAREWERGTMEQLISTPVRGPEIVIGKLIPYWIIGMLDVGIAMGLGYFLFDVPVRGNPILVLLMAGIFLLGALSIGMNASIVTKNQVLASQMALMVTYLPTMFLSGFVFALSNMPLPLQVVSYIVPARYFISLMRGVYLKGVGLDVVWPQALLLLAFAVLMFNSARLRFRKRLA
jgi:ABC-2 type transport system permease protein